MSIDPQPHPFRIHATYSSPDDLELGWGSSAYQGSWFQLTARVLLIVDFGINKLDGSLGGRERFLLLVSLASSMSTPDPTPQDIWPGLIKLGYGLIYSPRLGLILKSDIFSNSVRLEACLKTSRDRI